MHAGERFLEFFEREMPPAALGKQFVALCKIFVDEHQLGEFDGAPGRECFIVLHRPSAASQHKGEQPDDQRVTDHSFSLFLVSAAAKLGLFLSTQHRKVYTKNVIFTTAAGEFSSVALQTKDFS